MLFDKFHYNIKDILIRFIRNQLKSNIENRINQQMNNLIKNNQMEIEIKIPVGGYIFKENNPIQKILSLKTDGLLKMIYPNLKDKYKTSFLI